MAEQAIDQEVEAVSEEVNEVVESDVNDLEVTEEAEGEPSDEVDKDKPDLPWEVDEPKTGDDKVPLKTFLNTKGKLKALRSETDSEIESLKAENEKLKGSINAKADTNDLIIPIESDFDTDEEYRDARRDYERKFRDDVLANATQTKTQNDQQEKFNRRIESENKDHWVRAEKFVEEANVNPDVYMAADKKVVDAIEAVTPNMGQANKNFLIANLGEGSEKVMLYLGTKEDELIKFQSLLIEDPNGYKVADFLGGVKQKIKDNKKRTSQARKPASNANGGSIKTGSGKREKKAYDAAKTPQEQYKIRSAFKKAGGDVTEWE